MNKQFASLHARTFCHATEDLDKVKRALENTIGKHGLEISKTEGHHGNPIAILESSTEDIEVINEFFERLGLTDIDELASSLGSRIDDGCNLFIRIDKQAAFKGEIKLGRNDDVILIRVKVRAFPARHEIATSIVEEYLEEARSKRT